jgi:hypothetical protein
MSKTFALLNPMKTLLALLFLVLVSVCAPMSMNGQQQNYPGGTSSSSGSGIPYGTGGGTAQAQTVTTTPNITALTTGTYVTWLPTAANTAAAPTLAAGTTAATAITKCGTVALVAGDLLSTVWAVAQYDGTEWVLQDPVQFGCSEGGLPTSAGTANAQTLTVSPAITAYITGAVFNFTPGVANTGATTVAVSGLGTKNITKCGTTALVANDLTTTAIAIILYDGTEFQLLNPQATACGTVAVPSPIGGAISRVNQGCFGNLNVSGGVVTQSLGWTTASGDFLVLQVAGLSITITSATASGATMTQDATVTDGFANTTALMRLANTGSVSSVTVNFTGSNGSIVGLCAAEYRGVSPTATPVNTAVVGSSGAVNTNTWTNGAYTAAYGNLVLSGAGEKQGGGVWGAGSGWTMVANFSAMANSSLMMEEQLNVSAGSFTGTGTWSLGAGGAHYTYYTVSYQAALPPQTVYVTGNYTNATTSFTPVTGVSFAVNATTNYKVTCDLDYQTSATTADIKIEWTGPASPTAVTYDFKADLTATTSATDSVATAFATSLAGTGTPTTAANLPLRTSLTLINGANAGTLQLQAAATGTGTITIIPGSCTELTQ